jgi:hypothetical protein
MAVTLVRSIPESFLRTKGRVGHIRSKNVLFEVLGQRDVAGWFHSLDRYSLQLFDVFEDVLKLQSKGFQLRFIKIEFRKVSNFEHFSSCDRHDSPPNPSTAGRAGRRLTVED